MDKIIEIVAERAGISPEIAAKAVDAVVGFLKENPEQITALLGNVGGGDLGEVAGKLGKLFGR